MGNVGSVCLRLPSSKPRTAGWQKDRSYVVLVEENEKGIGACEFSTDSCHCTLLKTLSQVSYSLLIPFPNPVFSHNQPEDGKLSFKSVDAS